MRIFSSDRSGFSLDGGKTWKYMNFNLKFGFEDGQINWDGRQQNDRGPLAHLAFADVA